jgi:hypothetical protein
MDPNYWCDVAPGCQDPYVSRDWRPQTVVGKSSSRRGVSQILRASSRGIQRQCQALPRRSRQWVET